MKRLFALVMLLAASPAAAEVMDKEPTVGAIWQSVALAVGIALVAAALQRWLLVVTFLMFQSSAAVFAWTECHDVLVGPAILSESGPSYSFAANLAVSAVLAAHALLWFVASWWRSRRRPALAAAFSSRLRSLAYTVMLTFLLALGATSGFGAGPSILWSAPFFVAGASVLASFIPWPSTRHLDLPRTAA